VICFATYGTRTVTVFKSANLDHYRLQSLV